MLNVKQELAYGYDEASPDGDYSAVAIRKGDSIFSFSGEEAKAIQQLLADTVKSEVNKALDVVGADLKPLEPIDVGALTGGSFGLRNGHRIASSKNPKYVSSQTITEAQGAYLIAHNQLVGKILSAIEQVRKEIRSE